MNTSIVPDSRTARTNETSARQRAINLYTLGSKRIIELCCGPSLKVLKKFYSDFEIECSGNDIEERWRDYYPEGDWYISDYKKVPFEKFDTVVFAPPLTKGCTGKRVDSLPIGEVSPSYDEFLEVTKHFKGLRVLVLPARSVATKYDRNQYYKLLSKLSNYEVVYLTEGRRNVRKYVDIYIKSE